MSVGIFLSILGAWVCLLFAGINYVRYRREEYQIQAYLGSQVDDITNTKQNSWDWVFKWFDKLSPIGTKVQLLSDPLELESHLMRAGFPYGLSVDRLQGAKIAGALVGFGIGVFMAVIGIPFASLLAAFGPLVGYLTPIMGIRWLAKRRQERIRHDLPDFLDMMSITLQAGLSLDEALSYYVETTQGPLSEEISRMNQEIRFGVQREFAYRSLLSRTDAPELEALIQSLIQAHNLGTPLSDTFAQQADEMRRMRAERAKELAGKASPKISLVGGLVIAPSIMLLVLGAFILKYFFSEDSPFKGFF